MAEIQEKEVKQAKAEHGDDTVHSAIANVTPADHKAAQAAAQDKPSEAAKQVPSARMQPDIPPEIMQNTPESNVKYDQLVGGLVQQKLLQNPDSKSGSLKPEPDAGVGEPPTALDRELYTLSNRQLAERLQKDQNDPELRKHFEESYIKDLKVRARWGDMFEERQKSDMMATLYQKLTGPGSSKENQKLGQQLKADFQDPEKSAAMLQNFQQNFLDKYSAIFNDKSNPNHSSELQKEMTQLKDSWKSEPARKEDYLREGIQWPGKGKNCCCASERDKAMGMISWIEKGARAQNSGCHMNYLEQYFPPKSIEFQKN